MPRARGPTREELIRIRDLRAAVAEDVAAGRIKALSRFRDAVRQQELRKRAQALAELDRELIEQRQQLPQRSIDDPDNWF